MEGVGGMEKELMYDIKSKKAVWRETIWMSKIPK